MVGIAHGFNRSIPSICPFQVVLIHQETHKFSRCNRWVGIVDMDRDLLMNILERTTLLEVGFDNGLQTCTGHEVFLDQAQLFSFVARVVWIENGSDVLHPATSFNGRIVQFILLWNFNIPKPEIVDIVIAKANLRHIVRNGPQGFGILIKRHNPALFIGMEGNISEDFNINNIMVLTGLPDIAQTAKPSIRNFYLIAIYDALLKEAIAIANPISKSWIASGCQRVHEGSRQATQTAIAQSHVILSILNILKVNAQLGKAFLDRIKDT